MADTLYEAIGGRLRIQAAVELFYAKVFADETLAHFFKGVDAQGLQARQGMFISMLLGGKAAYPGRHIREAHSSARLQGLTDVHFDGMINHFRDALNEIEVEPDRIADIMARIEGTRDAVLDRGPNA